MTVPNLLARWRSDADRLRRYGDDRGAAVVEQLADELEAAIRGRGEDLLSLTEASGVSGYSSRRLRELVNEGKLQNHGVKGRPRFRRADLPMKPTSERTPGEYDPTSDALSLADRMGRAS